MSLNHIELKDIVVDELFRNHLLASEGKAVALTPIPPVASVTAIAAPAAPAAPVETIVPPVRTPERPPAPAASPVTGMPPSPTAATEPKIPISSHPPGPLPASGTTEVNYKTLGNHRRKISILVQSPGVAFLPDEQLAFLTKMLEACKMNMADVAIINHATQPVNIATLKQQLQPSFVLLFGLQPAAIRLPIDFPHFKNQAYDQTTYLSSPSLAELITPGEDSKLLKSKLWVSLKTLFNI